VQELDNMHELYKHNEDTLKKKDSQLDRVFKELSEKDKRIHALQSELDVLKNELNSKHQELKDTSKYLEENLTKIDAHPHLEQQLNVKESAYGQLKAD